MCMNVAQPCSVLRVVPLVLLRLRGLQRRGLEWHQPTEPLTHCIRWSLAVDASFSSGMLGCARPRKNGYARML